MSTALERLNASLENGALDLSLLAGVEKEFRELGKRADELEERLIMIVRTGWPWGGVPGCCAGPASWARITR